MYQLRILHQNLQKFHKKVQNQNEVSIWKLKSNQSSWYDVYKINWICVEIKCFEGFLQYKNKWPKNKLK